MQTEFFDHYPRIALLGIPIDNLYFDEALEVIDQKIKKGNRTDNAYISTINVDFLTHSVSWLPLSEKTPSQSNSEVIDILRKSYLKTADGMPLIWLSALLGSKLKERVTGADLVPAVAEMLAEKLGSVYLLGGEQKIIKVASAVLQALYPDLKIAGRLSPSISVKGEALEYAPKIDAQIVEEVNRSNANLLVINLGHPKQEIWFERVRQKIKVPLAIGAGGTLDFIAGAKQRAPAWMQKVGLEWLYRLIQEPKRLWRRYVYGLAKLFVMGAPLVAYHNLSRLIVKVQSLWQKPILLKRLLFVSPNKTVAMLTLPKVIDEAFALKALKILDDSFSQDVLGLDFKNTSHITLEGFAFLIDLLNRIEKNSYSLFCVNISYSVRLLMRFHRIWDLILPVFCASRGDFYERIWKKGEKKQLFLSLGQNEEGAEVYFLGPIVHSDENPPLIDRLIPILRGKKCRFDLSFVTEIDNNGFSFLLELKNALEKEDADLSWTIGSKNIWRAIKNSGLERIFNCRYNT